MSSATKLLGTLRVNSKSYIKNCREWYSNFIFSKTISLGRQTVHMKYQALLSQKNNK